MVKSKRRNNKSIELTETVVRLRFIYSMCGLVLGLLCMIGGVVLLLHGLLGSVSWATNVLGLESEISDAPFGGLLFITGRIVIFLPDIA